MREEKFRQFLGSILVWSYWTPWRQKSKNERKRELATSFCSSQRFLSLYAHKCTIRSSVFDLRAVVLVAAPFFPPSFLFPHAAQQQQKKSGRKVSQRGTEEKTKAERKREYEKNVTCQSGESCTSFTGLVGSRPGGARS